MITKSYHHKATLYQDSIQLYICQDFLFMVWEQLEIYIYINCIFSQKYQKIFIKFKTQPNIGCIVEVKIDLVE